MLDELKALIALEATGTISQAAVRLRLTQSAVSKRLQALEATLGYKVVEPDGRKLQITAKGVRLLSKAKPLLLEIESLKDLDEPTSVPRAMAIGVADSIASSWGPRLLKKALKKVSDLELKIHVHRSTLVLEHIRSGRYELGLVTGGGNGSSHSADLVWNLLLEEPMVLVGRRGSAKDVPILTIETNSATWKEVGSIVLEHEKLKGREFVFVESFSAAVQMAKEGFGQAVVPQGLVRAMQVKSEEVGLLSPRVKRRVYLVARKSIAGMQCIENLGTNLQAFAKET